jgi:hypothetical protein
MGVQISQFGSSAEGQLAAKIAAHIKLPCPSWRPAVDLSCWLVAVSVRTVRPLGLRCYPEDDREPSP